jgi:hypothetical protein
MDIILNAKFGDGCIFKQKGSINYQAYYSGTCKEWIEFKASKFNSTNKLRRTEQHKDAWGSLPIYSFKRSPSSYITEIANASVEECIERLTVDDLICWYLDDGSWHKPDTLCISTAICLTRIKPRCLYLNLKSC